MDNKDRMKSIRLTGKHGKMRRAIEKKRDLNDRTESQHGTKSNTHMDKLGLGNIHLQIVPVVRGQGESKTFGTMDTLPLKCRAKLMPFWGSSLAEVKE